MKIEYLDQVSTVYPSDSIVRIYDFDRHELDQLVQLIDQLILTREVVSLELISGLKSINCRLSFSLGLKDLGISGDPIDLTCVLTHRSYEMMKEQILSYSKDLNSRGHQWLYDLDCKTDLLLSQSGSW